MSKIEEMKILGSMKWLKFSEAMIYARMSKKTLKKYIDEGEIDALKRGGNWIVDRASIDKFYEDKLFDRKVKLGLI